MKTEKNIVLRKTEEADLEMLFLFQLDEESIYLAAFTPKDPADKVAYMEKWKKIVANPEINMQTIFVDGVLVGSVAKFEIEGEAETSYWIDRKYWNQGIATTALNTFLKTETTRPIRARVAFDNYGSQKVLEKCGYLRTGEDKGFANARQAEIKEYIYKLS